MLAEIATVTTVTRKAPSFSLRLHLKRTEDFLQDQVYKIGPLVEHTTWGSGALNKMKYCDKVCTGGFLCGDAKAQGSASQGGINVTGTRAL